MAILVSGYSVVSLPKYNYEEDTEVELFKKAPQVNGVYYAGYQRNEFGEMDKLYRNNLLPDNMKKMYSRVRENQNKGLYDYYVTEICQDAISMRNYLNSSGGNFEMIALYSKGIEKYLGSWKDDRSALFLGYDIDADGYSVILSSFFEHADLFQDEISLMNENGLLSNTESVSQLINKYVSIQGKENIEEIAVTSIDVVAVYQLC